MKALILIAILLASNHAIACLSCARGSDPYTSFVPMGPDGKARYYGTRYDKTEVEMTTDKNAKAPPPEEEKPVKKAEGASTLPTKKKSKIKD